MLHSLLIARSERTSYTAATASLTATRLTMQSPSVTSTSPRWSVRRLATIASILTVFGLIAYTLMASSVRDYLSPSFRHIPGAFGARNFIQLYFVRNLFNGSLAAVDSNASDLVGFNASFSRDSWLQLFPVRGENETDDRIVHQMTFMEKMSGKNRTMKYILRVGDFNWEDWLEGRERFVVDECPIKDCWLTSDSSRAQTADALLFSQVNGDSVKAYLPKARHQIWIAQHKESPLHNRIDANALSGLVNWTATYRRSSTVYLPYEAFVRKDRVDRKWYQHDNTSKPRDPGPDGRYSSVNFAAGKTKKVAWFVSNCYDRNGRRAYADQLGRYIDVDIYGACGKHSCPKSECRTMLSQQYKFYLAFENSNCAEYITEKLTWQALPCDVLPVVMGARPQDYVLFAPPGSYIHVDDFRSPRHLADYLHYLDKNDTAYNEYFKWKDTWTKFTHRYWCRLCAVLHAADEMQVSIESPNYTTWWNDACNAHNADDGSWKTWRPVGFWRSRNASSLIDYPAVHIENTTS